MPVGAAILPCCCGEDGNCGGLSHANAPDTISVSGGFVSVMRWRFEFTPAFQPPSSSAVDTVTTYTRSFQGVLNKAAPSSWNCALTCGLYTGRVETEWSISQSVFGCGAGMDGSQPWLNCNGHTESASHTYGSCPTGGFPQNFSTSNSCLPTVTIYCSKTGTGTNSLGTCPPTLCDWDSCATPFPYLVAHFSTICGTGQQCGTASGIGIQYPYLPTFPWPGRPVPWQGALGQAQYLAPNGPGDNAGLCVFQPNIVSWTKGGSSVGGSYIPARNNFAGTQGVQWSGFGPPNPLPCEPPLNANCDLFPLEKQCDIPDRFENWQSGSILESFLEVS